MTVDLNTLGGDLIGWLKLLEEQMDTSTLQKEVQKSCCEKPCKDCETAVTVLSDLSETLSRNGFLGTSSELQIIIAAKIQELIPAPIAAAAAAPKAAGKPELPTDPIDRKIALIKREKEEVDNELQAVEGTKDDDKDIRALRIQHADGFKADLDKLLEKVLAAKAKVLPEKAPAAVVIAPAEAPKAPAKEAVKKADAVEKAPAAVVIAPAAAPKAPAATAAADAINVLVEAVQDADPELVVQIAEKEDEIASLIEELVFAQEEGNQAKETLCSDKLEEAEAALGQLKRKQLKTPIQ